MKVNASGGRFAKAGIGRSLFSASANHKTVVFTIDTNIAVDFLDGDARIEAFLDSAISSGVPLYIPATVETELFSYSKLSQERIIGMEELFSACAIIQTNTGINRSAGTLRREYHMKLGDALIAATALFTGTRLLTRNVRDFKNVPGLSVQTL